MRYRTPRTNDPTAMNVPIEIPAIAPGESPAWFCLTGGVFVCAEMVEVEVDTVESVLVLI